LFERQDQVGPEGFSPNPNPVRRSWTSRPLRWQNPLPPEWRTLLQLESELEGYFTDKRGNFDHAAFWWLCACAIYPALRWNLTIYLGLKLTMPRSEGGGESSFYAEERALRLAALPWFREGFMPNWLRLRLIALLPKAVRAQVAGLLRDLLERAVKGQAANGLNLRIA